MIHLDLKPEIEARLAAEAQSRGISLERHLTIILESHVAQLRERDLQQGLRDVAAADASEGIRQGLTMPPQDLAAPPKKFLMSSVKSTASRVKFTPIS